MVRREIKVKRETREKRERLVLRVEEEKSENKDLKVDKDL